MGWSVGWLQRGQLPVLCGARNTRGWGLHLRALKMPPRAASVRSALLATQARLWPPRTFSHIISPAGRQRAALIPTHTVYSHVLPSDAHSTSWHAQQAGDALPDALLEGGALAAVTEDYAAGPAWEAVERAGALARLERAAEDERAWLVSGWGTWPGFGAVGGVDSGICTQDLPSDS